MNTELNRIRQVLIVLVGFMAFAFVWWQLGFTPSTTTVYSAVTLNNGTTLYGRLSGLGDGYPVLKDVFTLERQADGNFVLTPRLNEWHAPVKTIINAQQIVLVEPVAAYSRLGQLISKRTP